MRPAKIDLGDSLPPHSKMWGSEAAATPRNSYGHKETWTSSTTGMTGLPQPTFLQFLLSSSCSYFC
eukprot:964892-Prorocentrum_minimum.AAC.6